MPPPSQPVPTVTRADVERVVRRDYDAESIQTVRSILDEIGGVEAQCAPHRVHLAVLKMADGDLEKLREAAEMAKVDYRDVLAYAEYPADMKAGNQIASLNAEERQRIIDQDWDQYQTWLNKSA